MEAKELTKLAVKALEDKKGEDIRVIDIHGVSVLADYFVIADGSNASQVKAMADNVEEELGKAGHECRQIEGYQTAGWILMRKRNNFPFISETSGVKQGFEFSFYIANKE